MMEHTALPWKACHDGDCFCKSVNSDHHPICNVINGEWGDDYPSLRFVEGESEGSIGSKIEAYTEQITYGEIPDEVATANIKFIVRACNSHYDLLEALEALIDGHPPSQPTKMVMMHREWALIDKAKQAIAKAKE